VSIECYLSALDSCYQLYREKIKKQCPDKDITLASFDTILFHSPYCKLVQKSFARLAFIDFLNMPVPPISEKYDSVKKFHASKLEQTYFDRDIEKGFMELSKTDFQQKTQPSLLLASQVGNMYTPSVYSGLVSFLISKPISELLGNKICIFSYGSGFCSSMYSITVTRESSGLAKIVDALSYVEKELAERHCVSPAEYTKILTLREQNCHTVPYVPQSSTDNMFPGTYFLVKVDEKYRRSYKRT
jgi:hydroxymethylglutaryl-CoA synthase